MHLDAARTRDRQQLVEPWVRRHLLAAPAPPPAGARRGLPALQDGPGDPEDEAGLRRRIEVLKVQLGRKRLESSVGSRLVTAAHAHSGTRRSGRAVDDGKEVYDELLRDDDPEGVDFRAAPDRDASGKALVVQRFVQDQPGALFQTGLNEFAKLVQSRSGASGNAAGAASGPIAVGYLMPNFHGAYPADKAGLRNSRELRTLRECPAALASGGLPDLGGLPLERFEAARESLSDSNWGVARRLELIAESRVSWAPLEERRSAAGAEFLNSELGSVPAKAPRRCAAAALVGG